MVAIADLAKILGIVGDNPELQAIADEAAQRLRRVVAAIAWAVTARDRRPLERGEQQGFRAEPNAREILERRYANGELTHDEFEAMRRRLMS